MLLERLSFAFQTLLLSSHLLTNLNLKYFLNACFSSGILLSELLFIGSLTVSLLFIRPCLRLLAPFPIVAYRPINPMILLNLAPF
jgi:hypothetical protein